MPVQIGGASLRIAADKVLCDMRVGLGSRVQTLETPLEPESGAYGGGHAFNVEIVDYH